MAWAPTQTNSATLRKGASGWQVWAMQVALNGAIERPALVEDGAFGPKTQQAVVGLQMRLRVKPDGVFGPATSAALCARECDAIHHVAPIGLVKAFCDGESSRQVICVSREYDTKPPSRDYGPLQENMPVSSPQAVIRAAFNVGAAGLRVAESRQAAYENFATYAAVKTSAHPVERAWRMAILDYNWPDAAEEIARGHGDTWEYEERGTRTILRLADRTPWVENETGGRLHTGWEWCQSYIDGKAVYVQNWSVT